MTAGIMCSGCARINAAPRAVPFAVISRRRSADGIGRRISNVFADEFAASNPASDKSLVHASTSLMSPFGGLGNDDPRSPLSVIASISNCWNLLSDDDQTVNANRPPPRSTRRASETASCGDGKWWTPNPITTASKEFSGKGRLSASASEKDTKGYRLLASAIMAELKSTPVAAAPSVVAKYEM